MVPFSSPVATYSSRINVELLLQYFRLLKLKLSSIHGTAKLGADFQIPLDETTKLLYAYSATSPDGNHLADGRHVNTTFYRKVNNHHTSIGMAQNQIVKIHVRRVVL